MKKVLLIGVAIATVVTAQADKSKSSDDEVEAPPKAVE